MHNVPVFVLCPSPAALGGLSAGVPSFLQRLALTAVRDVHQELTTSRWSGGRVVGEECSVGVLWSSWADKWFLCAH